MLRAWQCPAAWRARRDQLLGPVPVRCSDMTNENSQALWAKVWQDRLLISLCFICNLSRCQESTLSFHLSFLFSFFRFCLSSFYFIVIHSIIHKLIRLHFSLLTFFHFPLSVIHPFKFLFIYYSFFLFLKYFFICFSTFLFIFFTSICCPISFFIQWLTKMLSVLAYNIWWKCKKVEIFQLFYFYLVTYLYFHLVHILQSLFLDLKPLPFFWKTFLLL